MRSFNPHANAQSNPHSHLSFSCPMYMTHQSSVYSDRNYKKFEQVFINYGEKGNGDLLLLYGLYKKYVKVFFLGF